MFHLWEDLAPKVHRHAFCTSTEHANEVILKCLEGFSAMLRQCLSGGTSSYDTFEIPALLFPWQVSFLLNIGCQGFGVWGLSPGVTFV